MDNESHQTFFVRLIEEPLSEQERIGNQVLREYFLKRGATPIRRQVQEQEFTIGFVTNRIAASLENDLDALSLKAELGIHYFLPHIFPVTETTVFRDLQTSQNNVLHNVWKLIH